MRRLLPLPLTLTPDDIGLWGHRALVAGLVFALACVAYFVWVAPDIVPFIPAVLLSGVVVWHLYRRPVLNLVCVLLASVVVAQRVAGLQLYEVAYGLYFLSFLGYWFGTRVLIFRESHAVFDVSEAKALFLFLLFVTLSIPVSMMFGGKLKQVLSEWVALALLGMYFPVKELVARHRYGTYLVLGVIAWIGLFIAIRNVLDYQQGLLQATQMWQVERGRVSLNDTLLAVPAMFALVVLIYTTEWKSRLMVLGVFLLSFAGLIMTQSRGYWAAFLFGALIMFVLVERQYKVRLVVLGFLGLIGVIGLGAIFLGDFFVVILEALVKRFTSTGTAATKDISLINRFYEAGAAWEHVKTNPILGHGMASQFSFYDITFKHTRVGSFIHNGYVSLWFKFGLWGLGLMVFFWWRAAWRGGQAFLQKNAPLLVRLCGLGACISLAAVALVANTSNPLMHTDSCFMIGVSAGIASGAYVRAKQEVAA